MSDADDELSRLQKKHELESQARLNRIYALRDSISALAIDSNSVAMFTMLSEFQSLIRADYILDQIAVQERILRSCYSEVL